MYISRLRRLSFCAALKRRKSAPFLLWSVPFIFVMLAVATVRVQGASLEQSPDDKAVQLRLVVKNFLNLQGFGSFHVRTVEVKGYNQNGRSTTLRWDCTSDMMDCPGEVLLRNANHPDIPYWWSGLYGLTTVSFSGEVCSGIGLLRCVWTDRMITRTCSFDVASGPRWIGSNTAGIEFDIKADRFNVSCVPLTNKAQFVDDVTIPDETNVFQGQRLVKTWRLRNTGTTTWDENYSLRQISGDGWRSDASPVPLTLPNQTADLTVVFYVPDGASLGEHRLNWDMQAPDGRSFGFFYLLVNVIGPTSVTPTPLPTLDERTPIPPVLPKSQVSFRADETSLVASACTTLRWDVDNVREVYFEGGGVSGHDSHTVCPAETRTYHLSVVHLDYERTEHTVSITVTSDAVEPPSSHSTPPTPLPAASVSFYADRYAVNAGECAKLFWEASNISEIYLDGEGVVSPGERRFCLNETRTYVLRAIYVDGRSQEFPVTITVIPPTAQPAPNLPPYTPSLLGPDDWAVFRGNQPTLCAGHNGDPENDGINDFRFEIYESAATWNSGWITEDCITPPFLGYYEFKWRAKLRDARGAESAWAEPRHYNVYEEYRESPNAPSLGEPGDWYETRGGMPRLCVNPTGEINGRPVAAYYFAIFESAFNWESGWISDQCVQPPVLGPATFQWHAKARSDIGDETGWSPTWHFTVREEFATSSNSPKLTAPDDWAELKQTTPALCARYEGTYNGKTVTQLRFIIYESAQGWDSEWRDYGGGELCLDPPTLDTFTFKWHVQGRTASGQETDWSEDRHFTIRP